MEYELVGTVVYGSGRGGGSSWIVIRVVVGFFDVIKGEHSIAIFLGFLVLGAWESVKKKKKKRERMEIAWFTAIVIWFEVLLVVDFVN